MKKKIIFGVIFLLITGLIIFTSTRSQQDHINEGDAVAKFINQYIFSGRLTDTELSNLKTSVGAKLLGHFSLYALDGLFSYLFVNQFKFKNKFKIFAIVFFGLALASCGEVIQLFAVERYSSFNDVIINYSGYLLPLLLIKLSKI